MKFEPYPYQQRAVAHIMANAGCGLFLGCGLGKSVITLTAVVRLIDACEVSRVLVVAPKKVAECTWTDEAAKWQHTRHLRVSAVLGTERQRVAALKAAADVYVTSRDNFVWLCNHHKGRMPYDMLVLDELTSFKTPSSRRFKALKVVRPQFARVVGLTGTPCPNGLPDLWAQVYALDGGKRLGTAVTRFRDKYFSAVMWNNIAIRLTPRPGAEAAIRAAIADICLSMQTEDYIALPPLVVIDAWVELPDKAAKEYAAFERDRIAEVDGTALTADSAAALMGKLSQWANGSVYVGGEDGSRAVHTVHTAKAERLAEIVEGADGAVLVFYQYRHDIDAITAALKGRRVRLYKDAKDLRDWNAGRIDVLLAHPASTAYGLNMQQGGHVCVWYGTGWDFELYGQANARLHRQGQTRRVTCYRILARGTVDERAAAALSGKARTQSALMTALRAMIKEGGR